MRSAHRSKLLNSKYLREPKRFLTRLTALKRKTHLTFQSFLSCSFSWTFKIMIKFNWNCLFVTRNQLEIIISRPRRHQLWWSWPYSFPCLESLYNKKQLRNCYHLQIFTNLIHSKLSNLNKMSTITRPADLANLPSLAVASYRPPPYMAHTHMRTHTCDICVCTCVNATWMCVRVYVTNNIWV